VCWKRLEVGGEGKGRATCNWICASEDNDSRDREHSLFQRF
jgi:hypothetical protein